MTVRRMLDLARRALEPIYFVEIETSNPPKLAYPGDTLVLTIESLRGRIRSKDGTERVARALVLADTATGRVLVALPERRFDLIGSKAADAVRHLPVTSGAAWHPLQLLVLGPPTPSGDWEEQLRAHAQELSIPITRETRRNTRRWTLSLLWRGSDELGLLPEHSTGPTSDLPLYDEQTFEAALAEATEVHNGEMERFLDASWDESQRSKSGSTEAAAKLLERLFPED